MNTAAKLGVFAAGLAVAFGVAAGIGAAAGPIDVGGSDGHASEPHVSDGDASDEGDGTVLGGLAVAQDGFRLVPAASDLAAGTATTFSFVIEDTSGAALTHYDILHESELHLVVLSRNLVDYLHLHPQRAATGRWSVEVPARAPGSYRVYADFQPSGGRRITLGTDLTVAGVVEMPMVPHPVRSVTVDGYAVELTGASSVGSSELTFTVTRRGEPVVTDPYLGAAAHLVAIRAGDLGYLHVHPIDATGSAIRFAADLPTRGTYRLFLEFSHGGAVHLATYTLEVGDEHVDG